MWSCQNLKNLFVKIKLQTEWTSEHEGLYLPVFVTVIVVSLMSHCERRKPNPHGHIGSLISESIGHVIKTHRQLGFKGCTELVLVLTSTSYFRYIQSFFSLADPFFLKKKITFTNTAASFWLSKLNNIFLLKTYQYIFFQISADYDSDVLFKSWIFVSKRQIKHYRAKFTTPLLISDKLESDRIISSKTVFCGSVYNRLSNATLLFCLLPPLFAYNIS